jgi:NAD(P)-dependent dehydrogenase (short-subunit alcohol dehydrogenase family)
MIILLTGSSKGIGSFLYKHLKKKFTVIGLARSKSRHTDFVCDISNKAEVRKVFSKISKVDILINNASVTEIYDDKVINFEETLKTNLNGAFYCSHYALPKLKKSKNGCIINISSINAHVGFPDNPGYIASKGGLNSLTRSLAVDYAKHGVKVNSLSLGYIAEGMSKKSFKDKKKMKRRKKNTLLDRWGKSEDVFGVIKFLISNNASYITGSDIVVDGGWLAKGFK